MEGRLELNTENLSNINETEEQWNLESERPFEGMEQPFSSEWLEEYSFSDSERPEKCLPDSMVDTCDANAEQHEDITSKQEGLTDEEKKDLKEKTGWPDEIIDAISSKEEAEIYEKADLQAVEIEGKWCLVKEGIDLDQRDEDGISNKERMERGRPPVTKEGEEIELHHIGQKADSPLAELTTQEHRGVGNDSVLHDKTKDSEIDRNEFSKERKAHWKSRVNNMEGE